MSRTKNNRTRCDWCGKLTSDALGHYLKPDGSGNYGRIVQPEWERFPGGDQTSANQGRVIFSLSLVFYPTTEFNG